MARRASRPTPVTVSGGHTFASIAAGGWDACALTPTGRAWCWGVGFDGAIGDGSDTNALVPAGVSGGPYSSIAVGAFNACAITVTGQAYCWGDNEYGSLGDGATSVQSPPTPVSGELQLINISVGEDIGCGITESGAGYCWGLNTLGSLGNGSTTSSLVPVAVAGGLQWRTIQVAEGVRVWPHHHGCRVLLGPRRPDWWRGDEDSDAGVEHPDVRIAHGWWRPGVRRDAERRGLLLGRQRIRGARYRRPDREHRDAGSGDGRPHVQLHRRRRLGDVRSRDDGSDLLLGDRARILASAMTQSPVELVGSGST